MISARIRKFVEKTNQEDGFSCNVSMSPYRDGHRMRFQVIIDLINLRNNHEYKRELLYDSIEKVTIYELQQRKMGGVND